MTIAIPANDHGQIRIFGTDVPLPVGLSGKTPEGFAAAFGYADLDPTYVDVLQLDDLGGLSLADYVRQGYDVTLDAIDAAALATLSGHAVLIMSRATGGKAATLNPAPGIQHVTTCGGTAKISAPDPIVTKAAKGTLEPKAKKKPSNAAMSGRVATVALLFMFGLIGLMVWIAG